MSKIQYCVTEAAGFAREWLPTVERVLSCSGYEPYVVHRVSGGTRFVYGSVLLITSVVSSALFGVVAAACNDAKLQGEAWKLLDFAVHGGANMVRGFIVAHRVGCLFFIFHDIYVPENNRLVYSRSIFKG